MSEPEPVTITTEGDLFQAAKQAFEDRCELELSEQEFIDHAMGFVSRHIKQENQMRALKLLGLHRHDRCPVSTGSAAPGAPPCASRPGGGSDCPPHGATGAAGRSRSCTTPPP